MTDYAIINPCSDLEAVVSAPHSHAAIKKYARPIGGLDSGLFDGYRVVFLPRLESAIAFIENGDLPADMAEGVALRLRLWAEEESEADYQSRYAIRARNLYSRACGFVAGM